MAVPRRVAAVILAAGGSSRLGAPKQLVRYQGEMLVVRAVRAAQVSGVDPVVVVLGGSAEQVLPELLGIPGVHAVVNDAWATGLASSCVTGLRAVQAVEPEMDGVLLMVADQPFIDSIAVLRLLDRFDDTHRVVAAAYEDTIGVPVVIGHERVPELFTLTGDSGAGRWLRAHDAMVTRVPTPEATFDIDTPDDVARLTRVVPRVNLPGYDAHDLGIDHPRPLSF